MTLSFSSTILNIFHFFSAVSDNAVSKAAIFRTNKELELELTSSFKVIGLALLIYRNGTQDPQGVG